MGHFTASFSPSTLRLGQAWWVLIEAAVSRPGELALYSAAILEFFLKCKKNAFMNFEYTLSVVNNNAHEMSDTTAKYLIILSVD